ncbi:ATP-dependent Clp protease adapter ClpS [Pseudemcibacter aquimaris]|uniref:ATP-dependent Clp protease adapter ClpS n=1 Tax=Pseudemcibacter aquimaris TaxID=2857064 RepID=UPI0020110EE7|nr:ATP-dependent Clp protease adapter ClpS [Pseudemcibacter aquimaris]MCC3860477.1 ATP-dependent Clp protease adapter ClpS [Pseudemcibacter aquimaris]WDU59302.1 ATP-dependent Clp protease adapter ClpS [Pseudemcibacter aquimaris]
MSEQNNDNGMDFEGSVITKSKPKTKKPSMYKVLMLNDDYTPMDFVVHVLQKFFRMPESEAMRVMLQVHQQGIGVCGVFTFEIAETKVHQVVEYARKNEHPLQCTLEKD